MLSGYWPVVGQSLAIATREGTIAIVAPEDEQEFAQAGWADRVHTFEPVSLSSLSSPRDLLREALRWTVGHLGLTRNRIGYVPGPSELPSSYSSSHIEASSIVPLLEEVAPTALLLPVGDMMDRLLAIKTDSEVDLIRLACEVAGRAFTTAGRELHPGLTETEAAGLFSARFSALGENQGSFRSGGFAYCMSGSNSAKAQRAYAHSTQKTIAEGEFVLIHANSYLNGYFTDITRTYMLSQPDARQHRMYEAVLAAKRAAIDSIRPGVRAADVDRAAREVLKSYDFAQDFPHPAGHGVGFGAISPFARPRIHPASDDILESGMVFNLEPAVYIENYGGLRHCDVVAVTSAGAEVLTPFQFADHDLFLYPQASEAA